MSIPRDIYDVHLRIINVIPEENNEFRIELQNYINSIWNLAPEVRRSSETFIPYAFILSKYIPDKDNLTKNDSVEWQNKIRDIFNGVERF